MKTDYQFESVLEDDGTPVTLSTTPEFIGMYRGVKVLSGKNDNGEEEEFNLYLFVDKLGENRSLMSNYQLDNAMPTITVGDIVKIVHHGKRDLGGGKTMNRLSIYSAKGEFKTATREEIKDENTDVF